jgi:hypothetical protein
MVEYANVRLGKHDQNSLDPNVTEAKNDVYQCPDGHEVLYEALDA